LSENECKICEGKKEVKNPVDGKTVICFGCIPQVEWDKFYASRDVYRDKLEEQTRRDDLEYSWLQNLNY